MSEPWNCAVAVAGAKHTDTAGERCSCQASLCRPGWTRRLGPMSNPAFDFHRLTVEQRLALIGEIWDSIVDEGPDAVQLSAEHRAELDRRLADAEADPDDVVPWEEVLRKLARRL